MRSAIWLYNQFLRGLANVSPLFWLRNTGKPKHRCRGNTSPSGVRVIPLVWLRKTVFGCELFLTASRSIFCLDPTCHSQATQVWVWGSNNVNFRLPAFSSPPKFKARPAQILTKHIAKKSTASRTQSLRFTESKSR